MENYAFAHITITQIVFVIVTVFAIFLGKYNKISDEVEVKEGHPYSFKKFIQNNLANLGFFILAAFVLLGLGNELGLEFLVKNIADVDFSVNQEKSVDITIAVLSAFIGNKIVKKFI